MNLMNEKSRNPKRIRPTLEKLEEAWDLYPDMRLGQLIAVCAGRDSVCGIEDEKMLERIQGYIDKMKSAGL
jgi:hypothetical protein